MSIEHEEETMVARQDGDVIFVVGHPSGRNRLMPLRPTEKMPVFHKRLKTEDLLMLDIYIKLWALCIMATSPLIWSPPAAEIVIVSVISYNYSLIRDGWRQTVYINSTQIFKHSSCYILQSTMSFIINLRYNYILNQFFPTKEKMINCD